MTEIKATTKKGQEIIKESKKIGKGNIYEAYGRSSSRKVQAWEDIQRRASDTEGYQHDLRVVGACTSFFSTLYIVIDEIGDLLIIKDTPSNTFVVRIGGQA